MENIIEKAICEIDIDVLKEDIKDKLKKYNSRLNNEQLTNFFEYIDTCEIKLHTDDYHFVKTGEDEYSIYAPMRMYYVGKNEIFSSSLHDIMKNSEARGCYQVRPNYKNSEDTLYHTHFVMAFKFLCGRPYYLPIKALTFDELVQHANDFYNGYLDGIIEPSENGMMRKVICTKESMFIYKIDFGEYGVYIGQSNNIKTRMSGHRSSASKGKHCYVLNELYKHNRDLFNTALKNVSILDRPIYFNEPKHTDENVITNLEYSFQLEALRNGEKLLGRQCWDESFRHYLALHTNEYEFQELLAKSFQINKDPNNNNGYSTHNPFAKEINNRIMNYEDVVKYFDSLWEKRESLKNGSFYVERLYEKVSNHK